MKVFSREKYLRVMDEISPTLAERRRQHTWSFECDGKTKEECNALGYAVIDKWMESHPSNCEYCREVDRVPLIHDSGMYVEVAGDELRVFGNRHHECEIHYCPICGRRL